MNWKLKRIFSSPQPHHINEKVRAAATADSAKREKRITHSKKNSLPNSELKCLRYMLSEHLKNNKKGLSGQQETRLRDFHFFLCFVCGSHRDDDDWGDEREIWIFLSWELRWWFKVMMVWWWVGSWWPELKLTWFRLASWFLARTKVGSIILRLATGWFMKNNLGSS
jgi:hypothetical protein